MRPVFLSYAYPPFEAPRAVQVERLARHVSGPVDVLCGEVERISGPPPAVARVPNVTRVPWSPRARAVRDLHARVLRGRVDVPDRYRPWAADAVRELRRRTWSAGDVLVSFGQPWSDHVAALRFARRADVPWVAHFSDPWTQNPLRSLPRALRPADRRLERAVLERADRLVFTNAETLELALAAGPPAWRGKASVLPHAFEPRERHGSERAPGSPVVARYLGALYGRRSSAALIAALSRLARERADALEGVSVELVGPTETEHDLGQLPPGLVVARPAVDYPTSLAMMASADLLLVLDAPAERSPFLPSKLVEYVGSERPIAALSPPGPSARLVARLGGWVADPRDDTAGAAALADAFAFARAWDGRAWGEESVRAEYRAERVAGAFEALLEAVAQRR